MLLLHASLFDLVSPDLVRSMAARLGETEPAVEQGLKTGAASLLSSLADQSADHDLLAMVIDQAKNVLRGEASESQGGNLLISALLGPRTAAATEVLAAHVGVKPESASTLLATSATLLLHWLEERVESHGLNVAALGPLLNQQQARLRELVPSGWNGVVVTEPHREVRSNPHPGTIAVIVAVVLVITIFIWYAMYGRPVVH